MGLSHTVSGDIASFRTPSRVPIESLKFHFLPKQAAGTPSPENPIPIEGWTGLNGEHGNGVVPNISNNNGMEKSGKIWRNTSLDSKTKFDAYIQLYKNSTYIKNAGYKSIADPGVYSITFNVDDSNCNRIVLIHSGSQTNLGIKFDFNLPLGTYTISFKAISVNPSISGGLSLRDIFIVAGENVESEVFPITFPDGQTIYGGYVDPIAGEIVAEWKSIDLGTRTYSLRSQNENRQVWEFYCSDIKTTVNGNERGCNAYCSEFSKTTSSGLWSVGKFAPTTTSNNIVIIFVHPAGSFANGTECKEAMSGIQLVYELKTPIHIPIPAQDLKAFLDHNNFWSDANDITEVTYAVTESKDILATRRKAMDFDMGHRKKVKWNQWAPAVTGNKYAPYNSNKISVSIEDGIITQTFLAVDYTYRAAVTTPSSMKRHELNRYYYLSYEYCADFDGGNIGGSVGGQYLPSTFVTQADVWARCRGVVKRTETGNFDNYIMYLGQFSNSNGISIGSTCRMRNPIAIDLTQMFGAGNEPNTASKFERICALNGIDFTTYQPYDTGSDRWLIIP